MTEDMNDFFDPDDETTVSVTRTRLLADDVTFVAIIGLSDEEALEGRAMAPRRQIAYATGPDVIEGDVLEVVGQGYLAIHNGTYKAIEPHRVNDGAESRCTLKLIQAAA